MGNKNSRRIQVLEETQHKINEAYQTSLIHKESEIIQLRKELESLKKLKFNTGSQVTDTTVAVSANSDNGDTSAHSDNSDNSDNVDDVNKNDLVTTGISAEQIDFFVQTILTDNNMNISYLPDWVEKQLYYNFFHMLLVMIKTTADNSSFKVIGHDIHFTMKPAKKNT